MPKMQNSNSQHKNLDIEHLLETLPRIHQATAPTYFYTRLMGKRSSENNTAPTMWQLLLQPKIATLVLTFFITMNTLLFFNIQRRAYIHTTTNQTTMEAFAEEYNFTVSLYNYSKK